MATLTLAVNGTRRAVEVDDPAIPLLYVLRNDLGLTGTKFGCGLAQCGACTVLVDGRATRSCVTSVSAVQGQPVTTIEGLGTPERPDAVQAAFIAEQAAQCGYLGPRGSRVAACSSGGSPRRRGRRCSGLAAQRLGRRADELEVSDGTVRAKDGSAQVSYGALIGDRAFAVAVDPRAPLKDTQRFRYIGRSLPRPDVAAKVTGQHHYLTDLVLPKMLHARVVRPPSPGATLRAVDASSIASVPGAHVVRLESFRGVVAEREWDVVRAAGMLKSQVEGNIIRRSAARSTRRSSTTPSASRRSIGPPTRF